MMACFAPKIEESKEADHEKESLKPNVENDIENGKPIIKEK